MQLSEISTRNSGRRTVGFDLFEDDSNDMSLLISNCKKNELSKKKYGGRVL